jgi:hypothetical protein
VTARSALLRLRFATAAPDLVLVTLITVLHIVVITHLAAVTFAVLYKDVVPRRFLL